jgi:hypothetical protein
MPKPESSYLIEWHALEREALGLYREICFAVDDTVEIRWAFVRTLSRKLNRCASDIVKLQVLESQARMRREELDLLQEQRDSALLGMNLPEPADA